jgi:ubiquinone/menaquinone biosynthesis C-methylase UbiE
MDPNSPASPRESIAQFFDGVATERNAIFRSNPVLDYEQQVRSRAVLDLLAAAPGDIVLDVGCGNARDLIPILHAGARVVGIDLSEGMIRQARADLAAARFRDVELAVGDATRLTYPNESFGKLLCSEVIEHIPDADAALGEMARVLKPGGTLVISTPNRRSWYGCDRYLFTHVLRRTWNHPFDNWRTMPELRWLLERHGFEVRVAKTVCYLPGFLLTYPLPRALQQAVVTATTQVELLMTRIALGLGYLNVIRAVRRTPTATQ